MAKKEAQAVIEKAQSAADRAVQERDDARIIAEEKTKNTDLLLKQIQDAQSDLDAYKALQSEYDKLSVAYTDLQHQLETAKLEANLDKERAMRDLEMENVRLNALLEKK